MQKVNLWLTHAIWLESFPVDADLKKRYNKRVEN